MSCRNLPAWAINDSNLPDLITPSTRFQCTHQVQLPRTSSGGGSCNHCLFAHHKPPGPSILTDVCFEHWHIDSRAYGNTCSTCSFQAGLAEGLRLGRKFRFDRLVALDQLFDEQRVGENGNLSAPFMGSPTISTPPGSLIPRELYSSVVKSKSSPRLHFKPDAVDDVNGEVDMSDGLFHDAGASIGDPQAIWQRNKGSVISPSPSASTSNALKPSGGGEKSVASSVLENLWGGANQYPKQSSPDADAAAAPRPKPPSPPSLPTPLHQRTASLGCAEEKKPSGHARQGSLSSSNGHQQIPSPGKRKLRNKRDTAGPGNANPRLEAPIEHWREYYKVNRTSWPRGVRLLIGPPNRNENPCLGPLVSDLRADRAIARMCPASEYTPRPASAPTEPLQDGEEAPKVQPPKPLFKALVAELFSMRGRYEIEVQNLGLRAVQSILPPYRPFDQPHLTTQDVVRHLVECGVTFDAARDDFEPWSLEYLEGTNHSIPNVKKPKTVWSASCQR